MCKYGCLAFRATGATGATGLPVLRQSHLVGSTAFAISIM